ncbi:phosphotransferase [Herbiconiux sp. CPCC 203407]|uniref:Phosphotransferase n=1 Tax=Herbiconiux oxytropis TaxID=2970915 RepID=A0AA41XG41_9MICO|nr:phosphotransferase [Herbiconiux oxytropis]MCS5722506.1 phosphotransferase [Herbiconiux oxytropis]MCS5727561.1 phosphotransferase [Herbiconiux oxytropis]
MPRFRAILVEDEPTAAQFTTDALEAAGFDVVVYADALSAQEHVDSTADLIDLLVLDRRLPFRPGEAPSDEVGDDLLTAMLLKHPDLAAIVFSGHTGFEHLQFATTERGIVSLGNDAFVFDRVRLFEKGQSLEFDEYVGRVHHALSALQDIQITGVDPAELTAHNRRLLRRVAFEFGGSSIDAHTLSGGLTGSPVWLCTVESDHGSIARVVAKRQIKTREPGGFQNLCPAQITAGVVDTIKGFCGGFYVTIQQLVGSSPTPLLDLIDTDEATAVAAIGILRDSLGQMSSGQRANVSIEEIAAPFAPWSTVVERGVRFGIHVPPGSRIAATRSAPRHGDLHPGNVLVADGHPVIIDFDSQTSGSALVDVLALHLGPLFHPDSPLFGAAWPTIDQCGQFATDAFLDDCPAPDYFAFLADWSNQSFSSAREYSALVLAYAVRQLKYPDVLRDDLTRSRAIALANWAAARLDSD